MSTNMEGKKGTRTSLIVGIAAGILLILAIAFAVYAFIRYRASASLYKNPSQSVVVISQPANMADFIAGTSVQVEVNASGNQPFTSLELWINGVLEGVEAGPPGGLITLGSTFSWIPATEGNYSLVARAVNTDSQTFVSSAVIVIINPNETGVEAGQEAGNVYPAVFPAAPAGSPVPTPPAGGEGVSPASPWQGTAGNLVTSLTSGSAPAAPEVAVTAEGCEARINIHDLSDNEEGFSLYRQTTASQEWVHVGDLASHAGQGWIETMDTGLSGGVTYYVEAFNSRGTAGSNLALENFDPDACPAPQQAANLPVLDLQAMNLMLEGGLSNPYCYSNLGGEGWSRWPDLGFLSSNGQLPLIHRPLHLSSLSDAGVEPGPQTMSLQLECWGWEGGLLRRLGVVTEMLDLVTPLTIHVALTGMAFDIFPGVDTYRMETFLLGDFPVFDIHNDPYYVENLGFVPDADQMPGIYAEVTTYQSECIMHNPDPAIHDTICIPMPGFTDQNGSNPQYYLVWYVSTDIHTCKAYPDKECYSLAWWQHFAHANPAPYDNGDLHFMVFTRTLSDNRLSGVGLQVELNQQGWRVLPGVPSDDVSMCISGHRWQSVALVAETSLGEYTNFSEDAWAPCVQAFGDTLQVEVEFDSMVLQNLSEGLGDNIANDVHGDLTARVNGQSGAPLVVGEWVQYGGEQTGIQEFHLDLAEGWYDLAFFHICWEYNFPCRLLFESQSYLSFETNNNKVVVTVRDGDALQLITDLDETRLGMDQPICRAEQWVGPRTLNQWASTVDEQIYLIPPQDDPTCNLLVILNALPPE